MVAVEERRRPGEHRCPHRRQRRAPLVLQPRRTRRGHHRRANLDAQAALRRGEARDLLAPIYGWFTEGFDRPDLKEAKALLDAVVKAKPATAKGKYVKKVNLASTMSPGVLLDEAAYAK